MPQADESAARLPSPSPADRPTRMAPTTVDRNLAHCARKRPSVKNTVTEVPSCDTPTGGTHRPTLDRTHTAESRTASSCTRNS